MRLAFRCRAGLGDAHRKPSRNRGVYPYPQDAVALQIPPDFIETLPIAIYACDAQGRLLWFNKRAADLWGRTPLLGSDSELYCGSHRLYLDGRQIARAQTPMAAVLR
ncbi:MAG: PAS domain-containing protein, partial [Mesorhizobium sp.]